MEKYKISEKKKKLIRMFVTADDLEDVSFQTGVGISTVHNIVSRRQSVNANNKVVENALDVVLHKRICEILPVLIYEVKELEETQAVKEYISEIIVNF